ncbi:peptidoglycan/xylan/chitin deacetylase (PgdA/CDA1 family) [Chryseomicrobium aureum]|uniref:polysaccharide deacetylase family protein n=1 Tax=Chryseomicrobium aureum TaxID=1441723 RepID=UPI001958FBAB|nr:polysaccharide deacetylase family protein [Chryseomicrobium aureum]MBM7705275.1 peptidoglycan/xylan/chitin deacetylase (PgdA/CDA1 family) [Chryseomicrobium aureum]
MKKQLIGVAALGLLLAACSDEQTAEPEFQEPAQEVKPEEPEEVEEVEEVGGEEDVVEPVAAEPLYKLNEANWTLVPIEQAEEKVVLLTIDDAPDTYSLEMAETLAQLEVPAIFFVNGHFLDTDEEKEKLKKIHELGFAIGNHTQTHPNLKNSSEEQQQQEILALNDTIEDVLGEKPQFFRAPFGVNTDFSRELVKQEGMLLMNWTYGYDWEKDYMEASALADIMVNTPYLTNGANLLMHDREWTAGALEQIVTGLQEKGYGFVDPDEIQGVE